MVSVVGFGSDGKNENTQIKRRKRIARMLTGGPNLPRLNFEGGSRLAMNPVILNPPADSGSYTESEL